MGAMNAFLEHLTRSNSTPRAAIDAATATVGTAGRSLRFAAALGAGCAGGVFFAFSSFIMKALKDLPDSQGIAAMQSINRAAPTPLFMGVLFGTAIVGVALGVNAARNMDQAGSHWVVIGAALYLVGIIVTAAYHVPHNDALARLDANDISSADAWHSYLRNWTAWNHVRMLTSLGGAASFVLAAVAARPSARI